MSRASFSRRRAGALLAVVCAVAVGAGLWIGLRGSDAPARATSVMRVSFARGTQLRPATEVRLSGVPVGTVERVSTDRGTGRVEAELRLQRRFAAGTAGTRATLQAATVGGATYVDLAAAGSGDPSAGRVSDAVSLNESLARLDPAVRKAVEDALQRSSTALKGRGADLSAAIGTLSPFAQDGATLLRILDQHSDEIGGLVDDGGRIAGALSARHGELSGLIADVDRLLALGDRRRTSIRRAVTALPGFEREARATIDRLSRFAGDADPLVRELDPVARRTPAVLRDLQGISPDVRALLADLMPLIDASRHGLPAITQTIQALPPALDQLEPLLRQVDPVLRYVAADPGTAGAFLADSSAALQGGAPGANGKPYGYLRAITPLNLESLPVYKRRLATNRPNAYAQPGTTRSVFENRQCGRAAADVGVFSDLFGALGATGSLGAASARPCTAQPPFVDADGHRTDFPRITADPADAPPPPAGGGSAAGAGAP
jgi:phospholipid/cholesterol/gamma-HCH transport system substrate-binding protein